MLANIKNIYRNLEDGKEIYFVELEIKLDKKSYVNKTNSSEYHQIKINGVWEK